MGGVRKEMGYLCGGGQLKVRSSELILVVGGEASLGG